MGGPGSGRKKGGGHTWSSGRRRKDATSGFPSSRTWSKKVGKKEITYDYQGKVVGVKKGK